jgi:hypothetical protein
MNNDDLTDPLEVTREIRAFDPMGDYALVCTWWEARGQSSVEKCALPRDGFFLVIDGVEIACAWLYVNNRSDIARVEFLITNPSASGPDIIIGKELLYDFLKSQADDIGKHLEIDEPFSTSELKRLLPSSDGDFLTTFEKEMRRFNEVDCPLTHRFTPGMYIRQIFMPSRSLIMSEMHKTEHPYVISQGDVSVWTREAGIERVKAPHTGITKPGTQRILFIHEDTIWTTFHVTDETDPEKIKAAITETRHTNSIEDKVL